MGRKVGSPARLLLETHGWVWNAVSAEPRNNFLLAALPEAEWLRWQPQLEPVEMPLGQVLCGPRATLTHVYFPTSSIVSLLYVMGNGDSAEIAVVGARGSWGLSVYGGRIDFESRGGAECRSRFRLKAQLMENEFNGAGPVLHLLLRYTQALITQMTKRQHATATIRSTGLRRLLVSYARGRTTVLDRPGLEKRSCECYAVVKSEYDRLLPKVLAT